MRPWHAHSDPGPNYCVCAPDPPPVTCHDAIIEDSPSDMTKLCDECRHDQGDDSSREASCPGDSHHEMPDVEVFCSVLAGSVRQLSARMVKHQSTGGQQH